MNPYRALGCAILLQAVHDARSGNGKGAEARAWLASDSARWLVHALDLDVAGLDFALSGLPGPRCEQLPLFDVFSQDAFNQPRPARARC